MELSTEELQELLREARLECAGDPQWREDLELLLGAAEEALVFIQRGSDGPSPLPRLRAACGRAREMLR